MIAPAIKGWKESCDSIDLQVKDFHDSVLSSKLSNDKIDAIYVAVQTEVKRMHVFSETIDERKTALSKKRCFDKLQAVIGTYGMAKIAEITGVIMGAAHQSISLRWVGVGIAIGGGAFDVASFYFSNKNFIESEEKKFLAELNQQGLDNAKVFKKLLKKLKAINEIEKERLEAEKSRLENEWTSSPSSAIEKLNKEAREFFKEYLNLTPTHQRKDTYRKMFEVIISKYPEHDSIKVKLKALQSPKETEIVDGAPSVDYLRTSSAISSSQQNVIESQNKGPESSKPSSTQDTLPLPLNQITSDIKPSEGDSVLRSETLPLLPSDLSRNNLVSSSNTQYWKAEGNGRYEATATRLVSSYTADESNPSEEIIAQQLYQEAMVRFEIESDNPFISGLRQRKITREKSSILQNPASAYSLVISPLNLSSNPQLITSVVETVPQSISEPEETKKNI